MTDEEVGSHFPVRGWRMKCGLRTDLPKKERIHQYVELGLDVRNYEDRGAIEGIVSACARCGTDKFKRAK
jgi:hypothetical protein